MHYQDWIFVADQTCQVLIDPPENKKNEQDISRFIMGDICDGYQLVTQKSTGYSKWVSRFELSTKAIDEAFYDADWLFKPQR